MAYNFEKTEVKNNDLSEKVILYILSLSLEELSEVTRYKIAAEFKVNKNYLSGKFKKHTKMSLHEYIEFEKMNRATILLKERIDLSIEDVSQKIGIIKSEQFRKKFKKRYRINPSQYRMLFKR